MNTTPEQDLMQKLAAIIHEDEAAALKQHVLLSDGLGAHVEEELDEAPAPKTALAGMSMTQVMNHSEFQAGVQEKLAERLPEITDAIEKAASTAAITRRLLMSKAKGAVEFRNAAQVVKKKGYGIIGETGKKQLGQMNARGVRGMIRRNPLKSVAGGALVAGGATKLMSGSGQSQSY